MATPGPKPKPTNLRLLQGNPGKRPPNKREPKPGNGAIKMPPDLDNLAKKEWQRTAPILKKLGLLTVIDHATFEAYCKTYSQWVRYTAAGAKSPVVKMKAKTGIEYPAINPFVTLADKALKHLKGLAAELGLTPSSRSRINADQLEMPDDLDEFMRKK